MSSKSVPQMEKPEERAEEKEFATGPQTPTGEELGARVDELLDRRIRRKLDVVVLPLLMLSMMMSYLDRGNIGNARVLGFQEDLGLTSSHYLNIVMMFYLGYVLIELPASMALRWFHPRFVFAIPIMLLGTIACCLAVANSYATLMVMRVLIGLLEVFVNNSWLYMAMWYRPTELIFRSAIMYSMTPVAGAVSGLIAYACGKNLAGGNGLYSWRWLFIIEGSITVGMGVIVLCLLPGLPDRELDRSWLFRSEEEKQAIGQRFRDCRHSENERFNARQLVIGLKDPKFWLTGFMVGTGGVGIGAFTVFLPTFIYEFGFDALRTQLLTIIPYAAGLFGLLLASWLTDLLQKRAAVLIACMSITAVGFIVLLSCTDKFALMVGVCLVNAGAYAALVISVSWTLTIHGGYTKRALVIWYNQVIVQGYSIIVTEVYRNPPRYLPGHGVALGLYLLGIICAYIFWTICSRANKRREQRAMEYQIRAEMDPDMSKSIEELCDFHPGFRYIL